MKAEINGEVVKLPDFMVVGAAKSGTTSLYHYLRQHPQIFMPGQKEPRFFAYHDKVSPEKLEVHGIVREFNDYLGLFEPAREDQILGEASVQYLYFFNESIENIKRFIPDYENLKIIMILREPAERASSHYSMVKMNGFETLSFEDAIDKDSHEVKDRMKSEFKLLHDYIGAGFYYSQVKAYLDNFPDVKIYLFDELKSDAPALIKDLFGFLGVDDSFVPMMKTRHNPSGGPWSSAIQSFLYTPGALSSRIPFLKLIPLEKRVSMVEKLRRLNIRKRVRNNEMTRWNLKDLYREDILKLQDLIGRDLSAWLN